MNKPRQRPGSLIRVSVSLCFFLSGAAGLIYEIVWMRMLGLIFGHTVFALTTVLAAFMAGLALGAYLFGRLIDRRGRPLWVYGLLEGGIGLYVLLIPFLFSSAQTVYLGLYRALNLSFFAFGLAQFFLAFLILLIPTTLMGASLPVLVKFFVDRVEGLGRKVGDLYAINTFGAVLGSVAAGFFLLPAIGVKATTFLAAVVNLGIGAWALLVDRRIREPDASAVSSASTDAAQNEEGKIPTEEPSPLILWLVIAGIGLSGASSMVYEVAWTRALVLIIGSSVYAFSAMLTTFLVGLALGGFIFARIWGRRPASALLFGWLELAIGLSALALIPAFGWMPDLVLSIFKRTSPSIGGALLTQFGLSFLVMIVPTTIIGTAFPCAVQICARMFSHLGRKIGEVYSANTIGCVIGAILAGFLLVPWIGARASMIAASVVNAAIGITVIVLSASAQPRWQRSLVVALALLLVPAIFFLPAWDQKVMVGGASIYPRSFVAATDPAGAFRANAASKQLVFYREGITSTVSVERTERMTSLRVNGKTDASDGIDMMTQLMLGHLPMFLHPTPENALVIGLGSGVTAGAMAQHPVLKSLEVVELEPAVTQASEFFTHVNRNVLRDPRVRVVIADGRNFILASGKKYDVIASEPSNPWMAGVANLFSKEFYELARQRLAEGGIMVQWVHGYSLFPTELRMIVNTFRSVFPHTTVWWTIEGDYLLVGTNERLVVDYQRLRARYDASPAVGEDFKILGWQSPMALLTFFLLGEEDTARYARGSSVNTDDRPLLEFSAPVALYANTKDENHRLLKAARSQGVSFDERLLWTADHHLGFARALWSRGDGDEARDHLKQIDASGLESATVLFERAKMLFAMGRVTEAMQDLLHLSKRSPGNRLIESYLKAGQFLQARGLEAALPAHGRVQVEGPNPAEAHNRLGMFYASLGLRMREPALFDLAVDSFVAALQVESHSHTVMNHLANTYFEQGRLDEAAEGYRRILRMKPDLPAIHFNLALVYERQGAVNLASQEYRTALKLQPGWELPLQNLRKLEASQKSRR